MDVLVCAVCGQEWSGLYVARYQECEQCCSKMSAWVASEEADTLATRFAASLAAYDANLK